MLEQCHVSDLSVQKYGDNDNSYDERTVIRVVESYVRTLVQKNFSHLQKHCQKMLSIVMTTSIEPLTCIPRYINFFIPSDDYII